MLTLYYSKKLQCYILCEFVNRTKTKEASEMDVNSFLGEYAG